MATLAKKMLVAIGFLLLCAAVGKPAALALVKITGLRPDWTAQVHWAVSIFVAIFAVATFLYERLKGRLEAIRRLERAVRQGLNEFQLKLKGLPENDSRASDCRLLDDRLDRLCYTLYDSGFPYTPERRLDWCRLPELNWQASLCHAELMALLDACSDLHRRFRQTEEPKLDNEIRRSPLSSRLLPS